MKKYIAFYLVAAAISIGWGLTFSTLPIVSGIAGGWCLGLAFATWLDR